jgi:predicted enzyme related to lactoylglutathione lyase
VTTGVETTRRARDGFDVEGVGRVAVLTDPVGAAFNIMQNPPG